MAARGVQNGLRLKEESQSCLLDSVCFPYAKLFTLTHAAGTLIVIQALDGGRRQGPDYGLVGSFFSGPAAGKLRPVELAGR
jgi:hypothetical protein